MTTNSLGFRLFISSTILVLIVLPIATFLLISFYRDAIERSFDARLELYLTTLIANSIPDDGLEPTAEARLEEPLFSIPYSGWYWQIKSQVQQSNKDTQKAIEKKAIFVSNSLVDELLPISQTGNISKTGVQKSYHSHINGQKLRLVERKVTLGLADAPKVFSYIVTGNSDEIDLAIDEFATMLLIAFGLLGGGLILATYLQVLYGLRPLRVIREGLANIRSGKTKNLEGQFPAEIAPLQTELNGLIESNHEIIERARTHVGNLAHALKTPLSVIQNEGSSENSPFARKVQEQAIVMQDQINHHLDRARMAARVGIVASQTDITPIFEGLERALSKIYQHKNLQIEVICPLSAKFAGERQDLEEMAGNLLDNACKWAKSRVRLEVAEFKGDAKISQVHITICDDGPGLSEEECQNVLKRGARLDESKPGSGLGLSIVKDLASLYKGRLVLGKQPKSDQFPGLFAELILPGQV